jgi:hypothetical protein
MDRVTRGTTNPQRLRRADRWLAHRLGPGDPGLVVDLGFGASPVTTVELFHRFPGSTVVGLEISPERVSVAQTCAEPGLSFALGGFDLGGRRAGVVRAFNVLRQYDEAEVRTAWSTMAAQLAPGGLIIEGTCDEVGRRACWVVLDPEPSQLVFAARVASLQTPSDLAERLPKALIHRNVPGEPIHSLLEAWDQAWAVAAPWGSYGPRARWVAAAEGLQDAGWPVIGGRSRWRLGELAVPWASVAPMAGQDGRRERS